MAELFGKDRRTITRHIQNIYKIVNKVFYLENGLRFNEESSLFALEKVL